MEGRRVDAEIEKELREARNSTGGGNLDDALGKTVPRESDQELLDEMNERAKAELQ